MAGHTFARHLIATERTLVFERVDPAQAATLDPLYQTVDREPRSIVFANTSVAEIEVTVEWERAGGLGTFIIADGRPVAVADSQQADMTPYELRPGDKIYATSSGSADVFVKASNPTEEREK